MPPSRIAKNLPQPVRRERDGMDRKHLANIRDLPCCVTGMVSAVEAHHLLRSGEHGTGRKSSDQWAIPLNAEIHRALHAAGDEDEFLAKHGVDGRALAKSLWAARGDIEAMMRVALRFLQASRLKRDSRPLSAPGVE